MHTILSFEIAFLLQWYVVYGVVLNKQKMTLTNFLTTTYCFLFINDRRYNRITNRFYVQILLQINITSTYLFNILFHSKRLYKLLMTKGTYTKDSKNAFLDNKTLKTRD